jgi:hypothetical protein
LVSLGASIFDALELGDRTKLKKSTRKKEL